MSNSTNFDISRQSWLGETGQLPVHFSNDYIFKAVNQEDPAALKSLICAVLHKPLDHIISVEVLNPILLGAAVDDKEYILDVKVDLNSDTNIDLEMQLINHHDWPERSLQYLCRTYDSLNKGEDYIFTRRAIHIGILDFELFKGENALLDSYRLMNEKTHRIYTDKFQLYTLCLAKANEPEDDDIKYHTDLWARFFKATTWEELKMLVKEDEGLNSAVETAYRLMSDARIRERVIAREDYERRARTEAKKMEMAQKQIEMTQKQLETLQTNFETAQKQLETTQKKFETTRMQFEMAQEKAQVEINRIQSEADSLKQEKEKIQSEADSLKLEKEKIQSEADSLRKESEKMRLENEELKRLLDLK